MEQKPIKLIEENPENRENHNNMDEKEKKPAETPAENNHETDTISGILTQSKDDTPAAIADPDTFSEKKNKHKDRKRGKKGDGKQVKKVKKSSNKDKKDGKIKNRKIDHLGKKKTRKLRKMIKKLEKATIISVLIKDQVDKLTTKISRLKKSIVSGKETAISRISLQRIHSRHKTAGQELKEAKEMQVLIREKIRKHKEKIKKLKSGKETK
jgi:hypothetical protein